MIAEMFYEQQKSSKEIKRMSLNGTFGLRR